MSDLEIVESFKYRLDKALAYREMKPADLAKKTGISEATISQYRSGYAKPKELRLMTIANALNVNPTWLMGLDVSMEVPITQTYSANSAEVLVKIKANPALMKLCENYLLLSPEQQQSVANLVQSMLPDKRLQQAP